MPKKVKLRRYASGLTKGAAQTLAQILRRRGAHARVRPYGQRHAVFSDHKGGIRL